MCLCSKWYKKRTKELQVEVSDTTMLNNELTVGPQKNIKEMLPPIKSGSIFLFEN